MRILGGFVAGLLTAALVAIAVFYFADLEISDETVGGSAETVTVPDVIGQESHEAVVELHGAGLRAEVSGENPGGLYDEVVASQVPHGGAEVEAGTTVDVAVE